MTPPAEELHRLYLEWRELTAAESAAIRAERWSVVTEFQRRKTDLQDRLARRQPADLPAGPELAALIRELLVAEADNARLMDAKLETGRQQRAELDRSGSNLRRLRGSYGQARSTTWQSYS